MQLRMILMIAGTAFAVEGCKSIDCGDGTIEKNGTCQPSDLAVGNAMCGPFTELQGTKCVPMFPPTECDPTTTKPDIDPQTGVTTCIGTGTSGGCNGGFACSDPTTGKQTICGQIYDFETNMPFAATGATGAQCGSGATSGPCALSITAYDAIAFGTNPSTATPLSTGQVYIDDCGRYRVPDITVPAGPFIGLGIDDADSAKRGPTGLTNTVGVATPKSPGTATKELEHWIVKKSTTDMWEGSGGPPLSGGYYAPVFRAHKMGTDNQAGVTITKNGSTIPANDFYFQPAQANRQTVDTAATATGANGTVLVTGAVVSDGLVYSAQQGALPSACRWETHAGANVMNLVFIQVFRPANAVGQTCPL